MRIRLFLAFTLVALVSVLTVFLIARQGTVSEVNAFMLRGGMVGLTELVDALEQHYAENGSWQGVASLLREPGGMGGMGWGHGQGMMNGRGQALSDGMIDQRLRVADLDGRVIADTSSPEAGGILSDAQLGQAIELKSGMRTVGYLLPEGGMVMTSGDEQQLLQRLNSAALTAALIAIALALVLSLILSYTLLKPVQALTRAASHLAQGDLSQRVETSSPGEFGELGRTFNLMAGSLQQAQDSRRAMTADIAHELRTPLAVQRAHLEALQDGVYELTPANLDPVLAQNMLLTRLVEDLRTLALAEAGQLKLELVPTDLAALTTRVVDRFQPQALQKEINLQVDIQSGAEIERTPVDPTRVEQILGNLISNALRHTPQGGRVDITLHQAEKALEIRVHDSGPGIPGDALPYIFERFYRAGRSRTRSEGGSGLGLSIARQLAVAHGGSLTAANHPQGGAIFTLTLPIVGTLRS